MILNFKQLSAQFVSAVPCEWDDVSAERNNPDQPRKRKLASFLLGTQYIVHHMQRVYKTKNNN